MKTLRAWISHYLWCAEEVEHLSESGRIEAVLALGESQPARHLRGDVAMVLRPANAEEAVDMLDAIGRLGTVDLVTVTGLEELSFGDRKRVRRAGRRQRVRGMLVRVPGPPAGSPPPPAPSSPRTADSPSPSTR